MDLQSLYVEIAQMANIQTFAEVPQKAASILKSPVCFFRKMPKTGAYAESIVFILVMSVLATTLQHLFSFWGLAQINGRQVHLNSIFMLIVPLLAIMYEFIFAGILCFLWKLMGSQVFYNTSFRCAAYLSVLMPLSALGILPYIGPFITLVMLLVTGMGLIIVSKEVHGIPVKKASAYLGIILFLLISLSVMKILNKSNVAMNVPTTQQMQR